MTAQYPERIFYEGKKQSMASEPLSVYLREMDNPPKFSFKGTACWRSYNGTWEINENKLYLIELEAEIEGIGPIGLDYIFPNKNTVFAKWFSGEIRIPQGNILGYVHQAYDSMYEQDILLKIEKGYLVDKTIRNNEANYIEIMNKAASIETVQNKNNGILPWLRKIFSNK